MEIEKNIIRVEKTSSTMDIAQQLVKEEKEGIVIAEEQTEGRGRYGRRWISPKGGLYFSIIIRKNEITDYLSEITSLSIIKTLFLFGINCNIKFPNDIIFNGKKIAGILIERKKNFYIVGIGLNVKKNKEIEKQGFISIEDIIEDSIEKEKVLKEFLLKFKETCNIFLTDKNKGLKEWCEKLLK